MKGLVNVCKNTSLLCKPQCMAWMIYHIVQKFGGAWRMASDLSTNSSLNTSPLKLTSNLSKFYERFICQRFSMSNFCVIRYFSRT